MNNVLSLTKIYIKQFIARLASFITKKKIQNIMLIIFIFVIFASIIASVTFQFVWGFAMPLKAMQAEKFIITYGLIISVFLSLMIVIYEIPEHFYKNKDYQTLASLPLRNWEVVTAKIITAYISIFLYNLIIVLPSFIAYFIYNPISVLAITMAAVSLLFLPMFILLVGCILGFFIHLITSRLKNKTLFSTIFMFLFIIIIMGVSFLSSAQGLPNIFVNGETPLAIKITLPFIYFLNTAITDGNVFFFIYFILINFAYLILAIWVISVTYTKINSHLLTTKVKISKKPISFEKQSPFSAMLKKESKSFFGSSIWTVNVLVGPLMIVVLAVVFGIIIKVELNNLATPTEKHFLMNMMSIMYLGIISMLVGMCTTTTSSISMESKKIQILKQLPISFNTMAFSKILFSFLLIYIPLIIANVIFLILNYISIFYAIALFVIQAIIVFACSVMGLVINLKFPKLIWKKETEVVKQGASLAISLLLNIFIGALPLVLFFSFTTWFMSGNNYLWFLLILLVWSTVYLVTALMLLKYKGKKLFEKVC